MTRHKGYAAGPSYDLNYRPLERSGLSEALNARRDSVSKRSIVSKLAVLLLRSLSAVLNSQRLGEMRRSLICGVLN